MTAKRVILKLNIILMETSPPGCNTIGNLAGSFVVILRGLVPCYDRQGKRTKGGNVVCEFLLLISGTVFHKS